MYFGTFAHSSRSLNKPAVGQITAMTAIMLLGALLKLLLGAAIEVTLHSGP